MKIWQRPFGPGAIADYSPNTLPASLGIVITEVGDDYIRAEMPVDERHVQPYGILHGGASVALAETLGSIGCAMSVPAGKGCVGLEINANHLAGVRKGEVVTAVCRPLHRGRTTHVWQKEIFRPDGKLACVSRLTTAVVDRPA